MIARQVAERNERIRLDAMRMLRQHEMGESILDEETLIWARQFVRMHKPLAPELPVLRDALPAAQGVAR